MELVEFQDGTRLSATQVQCGLYAMTEAVWSVGTRAEVGLDGMMADVATEIEVEKAGGFNFEAGLEDI